MSLKNNRWHEPSLDSSKSLAHLLICCAALSLIRQSLAVILTHVLEGTFIILHLMNCRRGAWLISPKPQQGCAVMRRAKSNKRLRPTRSHHGSRVSVGEGESIPCTARKNSANYQTGLTRLHSRRPRGLFSPQPAPYWPSGTSRVSKCNNASLLLKTPVNYCAGAASAER